MLYFKRIAAGYPLFAGINIAFYAGIVFYNKDITVDISASTHKMNVKYFMLDIIKITSR